MNVQLPLEHQERGLAISDMLVRIMSDPDMIMSHPDMVKSDPDVQADSCRPGARRIPAWNSRNSAGLPFGASATRRSGKDYGSSTNSLKRGSMQKVLGHSEICWVAFHKLQRVYDERMMRTYSYPALFFIFKAALVRLYCCI